jgi:hypothetical protein
LVPRSYISSSMNECFEAAPVDGLEPSLLDSKASVLPE